MSIVLFLFLAVKEEAIPSTYQACLLLEAILRDWVIPSVVDLRVSRVCIGSVYTEEAVLTTCSALHRNAMVEAEAFERLHHASDFDFTHSIEAEPGLIGVP